MPHAVPSWAEVDAALEQASHICDAYIRGVAVYTGCGGADRYFFVPAGVSSRRGHRNASWSVNKYVSGLDRAGRSAGGAAAGTATFPEVKLMDLVAWIEATWSKRDYVYLKLDVGGLEGSILSSLLSRGVLDKLDELDVTWHEGADAARAASLRGWVERLGIVLHEHYSQR